MKDRKPEYTGGITHLPPLVTYRNRRLTPWLVRQGVREHVFYASTTAQACRAANALWGCGISGMKTVAAYFVYAGFDPQGRA